MDLSDGEVVGWTERRSAPGPALRRLLPGDHRPPAGPRLAAGHAAPGHHRLRQGPDRPVAHRQLPEPPRGGAPDRPVPVVLPGGPVRQRLRPTGGGGAGHGGRRPGRGPRGRRLRGGPPAPRPGHLPPRGPPAPADRPPPSGDRPARGGELHPRRQPLVVAGLVHAGVDGPPRRTGPPHHRLRRRGRPRPSSTGPPSARWSSPTATRGPCTAGRTPSTWASGGSAAWPTPSPWGATAWGASPTSMPTSAASTATPTWWRTPSASTRRTTGSSGSTPT